MKVSTVVSNVRASKTIEHYKRLMKYIVIRYVFRFLQLAFACFYVCWFVLHMLCICSLHMCFVLHMEIMFVVFVSSVLYMCFLYLHMFSYLACIDFVKQLYIKRMIHPIMKQLQSVLVKLMVHLQFHNQVDVVVDAVVIDVILYNATETE